MEEHVKNLEKNLEDQAKQMQVLMQMITELKESIQNSNQTSSGRFNNETNYIRPQGMIPKLTCPSFDGTNPRMWIKKYNRYFDLCKIADEAKVEHASLYMIDKAQIWVFSYLSNRKHVDWEDFKFDLVVRFKDTTSANVVENFNKLYNNASLEEYVDSFEQCKSELFQNGHRLSEEYLLESFIGGLKEEVKTFVKAFNPTTISYAINYARLQEE